MKTQSFDTVKELNEFLKTLDPNIPEITEAMIPNYQGGPITAALAGQTPAGFNPEDLVGTVEVDDSSTIAALSSRLDRYIEFSIDQLSAVNKQLDAEVAAHQACHESFETDYNRAVKAARLRGYAEAICAGRYHCHLMAIPQKNRDAIYRTARQGIEQMDMLEAVHEAGVTLTRR